MKLGYGTLAELVCYPPAVEPEHNDWYERDGRETSGEPLRRGDKVVRVQWVSMETQKQFVEEVLRNGRYKGVISPLPSEVELVPRKVAEPKFIETDLECLEVSDTFPEVVLEPVGSSLIPRSEAFKIAGRSFSEFGCKVLKCRADDRAVWECPEGAKRLTRRAYEMTLEVLMLGKTVEEFWQNRMALLSSLVTSNDVEMTTQSGVVRTYYKGCKSVSFSYEPTFWWQFELSMVVIK